MFKEIDTQLRTITEYYHKLYAKLKVVRLSRHLFSDDYVRKLEENEANLAPIVEKIEKITRTFTIRFEDPCENV